MKNKMLDDEDIVLGDNLEQLLWEINEFCGPNNSKQEEIPPALENYLKYVAKTGNTVFPWQHVRPLFRLKMLAAINNFAGEMCINEAFVLERFDIFRAAPFTIQRLAELITQPNRHYKIKEKFLRGLEKTVLVVTTVEPKSMNEDDGEEDALSDEPMSWLSHSDGDGMSDSGEPALKTDSDLQNLNQLIATVHPAPAVEPAATQPPVETPPVEHSEEEAKKPLTLDHEEGISDTDMPLTVASSSVDYNIDISPSETSSSTDDFSGVQSLDHINVEQPHSNPALVSELASSESRSEDKESTTEPVHKVSTAEPFVTESSDAHPQIPKSCEENTGTAEEIPMEHADFTQDSDTKESSSTDSSGGDSSNACDDIPTLTSATTDLKPDLPDKSDVSMDVKAEVSADMEKSDESMNEGTKPGLSEPSKTFDNPAE